MLNMASDYVDNHDYISALKMLNKNAVVNGNCDASFMLYAEIFDDLRLYEKSINCWYKFLDTGATEDIDDAYESMALSYMNLGNEKSSAYYYNKLLIEAGEFSQETRRDIISSFVGSDRPCLKFAYPPKLADYSDDIREGVESMRKCDFEGAIERFERVAEENEKYLAARNYIAMCKIICDKCDEAEAECKNVLEKSPDNVQALTTLAAVKIQQRQITEARYLAKKLLTIPTDEIEDIYKIATVCCENGMHDEAYQLFCKIEESVGYDLSLLYFKAVAAYNSGRLQESLDTFDKLLTVYPNAVTARYYYEFIREDGKKKAEQREALGYFYRLPVEVRKSYLQIIGSIAKSSKKKAMETADNIDVAQCLYWCFEEPEENGDGDFIKIAGICAEKIEFDYFLRDILLNAFIPDHIKLGMLTDIYMRNEENDFGVVLCHVYKNVKIVPVKLPRLKRKNFIVAYSRIVARFGIISEEYTWAFNKATREIYFALEEKDMLDASANCGVLAALIYKLSGVKLQGVDDKKVLEYFDADAEEYYRICGELCL